MCLILDRWLTVDMAGQSFSKRCRSKRLAPNRNSCQCNLRMCRKYLLKKINLSILIYVTHASTKIQYPCHIIHPVGLTNGKAENHKRVVRTAEWNKLMFDPRCSVVKEGRHSVCHWLFKGEKGRRIYGKCCSPKHKALRGLYIE